MEEWRQSSKGEGIGSLGLCVEKGKKNIKGRKENQERLVVVPWLLLLIMFFLCGKAMRVALYLSFHKLVLCLFRVLDVEE